MSATSFVFTAVLAGLLVGWLNVRVLAYTWGRVASGGKPRAFVLSSFLRIGACAIVAGVFAAVGPWWSMALYLVALFVPFVLYAAGMSTRPNE